MRLGNPLFAILPAILLVAVIAIFSISGSILDWSQVDYANLTDLEISLIQFFQAGLFILCGIVLWICTSKRRGKKK